MNKKCFVFGSLVGAGAFMAMAARSNGALVYTTGFDGAVTTANPVAYTDGPLIGQDSWALVSSTVNPIQVANSSSNGSVSLTNNGQDVSRIFGSAVSSGSLLLGADVNLSAALTGDYFIHLGTGTTTFADRVYAKAVSGGFVLGISPSNLATTPVAGVATYGTTVLPFGTPVHIVAEYDFVPGGTSNDTAELYVNPTTADLSGDVPYAVSTQLTALGVDLVSINTVNLRQGSATLAPSETVDNITVSTIPAVPEPASVGVLGLFSLGMLRRRRAR